MKLTEHEVKMIVWEDHDDFETIEEQEGEARRWSSTDTRIVKHIPTGKLYSVYFENGLTEMQENEYEAQDAPEVKKVTKTVEVTSYEPVKNETIS
jgi:hypothetical protein